MNLLQYESVECTAYRTHAANHRFVEAFPAGNPYTYTVITNDTENQMNHKNKRRFDSRIIAGILFILVGVLILIDRANVIVFSIFDILALVAVLGGSIQIIQAQSRKDYREGTWWIFLGIWFYISYHQVGGYGFGDTWPLLIIALGIGHIWKAMDSNKYFKTVRE
jgi:uncharacterized membrane protein HdeD (DUF308 family)